MGITGTPVVDLASRALFLDAMTTPDGGTTIKHYIISLNVDTGAINSRLARGRGGDGLHTTARPSLRRFNSNDRRSPSSDNILYVGYGSMRDCDLYHGWLVGVPINNPASVTAWAAATNTGTAGRRDMGSRWHRQ